MELWIRRLSSLYPSRTLQFIHITRINPEPRLNVGELKEGGNHFNVTSKNINRINRITLNTLTDARVRNMLSEGAA